MMFTKSNATACLTQNDFGFSKLYLITILVLSPFWGNVSSADSIWNHLTCFYRTQGTNTNLRFEQHSRQGFDFTVGEIKTLAMAWTKKRPEFNVGYCTKLISIGRDDSAYYEYIIYKSAKFETIEMDCSAKGENIEVLATERKLVSRGQNVSFTLPWDKPFDSATVTEYIPTESEVFELNQIAWDKCTGLTPPSK